jgi:hypothetical protein
MYIGERPRIDSFFTDVLAPIFAESLWHPSAWLLYAGIVGLIAWTTCMLLPLKPATP